MFIVRALVDKISAKIGFQAEETDKLVLAVDEACTNVIRHAYGNSGDGRIVITFSLGPDCLEIVIRDFGSGADPATFQGRDLNEIRPGGLGIHFIKSAVDKVEYHTLPGGGTLLRMIKSIPRQESRTARPEPGTAEVFGSNLSKQEKARN
jgi:anti-sigma regulatory factor (Ser/Thr protein kinase)